ncbi:MAG: Hsp20/alpha crystallin family protein [Candidatus Latescibacterota bacterium]|nr:MAG: Hsp20/alpha crystallin family protein [Candidatus Latescibacterota bacterium]RKY63318.1 MAG: Hsp20/alpha crystallin family protein [Candidatus Latescibacterota bacterium]RKY70918.1 MAG: Hsp20/alpha crystallin family protein [Candidatus Latescibacterota bacterium]
MALVRWRPSEEWFPALSDIRREIDRIFDEFWRGIGPAPTVWTPKVDVAETDDAVVVTAELPGMEKDDIKVSIENNVLTISGEKKQEKEEKDRTYHWSERVYGRFSRSFTLPARVDANKVKAVYKNGVLTLTLPKVEEAKPKQIEITTE